MKYLTIFILLFSIRIEPQEFNYFIVWNVGQGLWQSYITPSKCYHFDMGGEKAPWSLLKSLCGHKQNIVRISHWDYDHYGFLKSFSYQFKDTCLSEPNFFDPKLKSKNLLKSIQICETLTLHLQSWRPNLKNNLKLLKQHGSNAFSEVLRLKNILLTGDSPKELESIWIQHISLKKINTIVVGHHGSNTSSSHRLLKALQMQTDYFVGLISARKKRYGHPHWAVKRRFKKTKAPLISTEQWGHLVFQY